MNSIDNIDVDKKLDEIIEKNPRIPKERLREVYDKLYDRVKKEKAQDIPMNRKKVIAYFWLNQAIKESFPIAFCPFCNYYTYKINPFRDHLKNTHNCTRDYLTQVRNGFFAAKNNKKLDFTPKLP